MSSDEIQTLYLSEWEPNSLGQEMRLKKELSTACGNGDEALCEDEASQTCVATCAVTVWQPDADGDDLTAGVGMTDLLNLMLLSVFGDTDVDQDGIFDSGDSCVGFYDEELMDVQWGRTYRVGSSSNMGSLHGGLHVPTLMNWGNLYGSISLGVQQDTLFQLVCSEEFLGAVGTFHRWTTSYQGYGFMQHDWVFEHQGLEGICPLVCRKPQKRVLPWRGLEMKSNHTI